MKKITIILTVFVFAFSSCKKEEISKCANMDCGANGVCEESTGQCKCTNNYTGIYCQTPPAACSVNNTGSVIVNSAHSDAYEIYINGVYKGYQYYGTTTYNNIPAGYITITEKQVDYIVYQNVYSQAGTLVKCGTLTATF